MEDGYPQKYWWVILIALPIIIAIIGIAPQLLPSSGEGGPQKMVIIEREYREITGQPLSTALKIELQAAITLAEAGQHEASVARLEMVAREVKVPAVYESIAELREKTGDADGASEARVMANSIALSLNESPVSRAASETATETKSANVGSGGTPSEERPIPKLVSANDRTETEPNNDVLNPTPISVNQTVTAEIKDTGDTDYFSFITPKTYRDVIEVRIENRSTTLQPRLGHYNEDKTHIKSPVNFTSGGNVVYSFVSEPAKLHYISVTAEHGTSGAYRVTAHSLQRYDSFEPNDTILVATKIDIGRTTAANVMDEIDQDFFVFKTGGTPGDLQVRFENRSQDLAPWIQFFNANRSAIADVGDHTYGAHLEYTLQDAAPNSEYYVQIHKNKGAGDYALTVTEQ